MLNNFKEIFAPSITDKIKVTGTGEVQVFCPFHSHSYNTPSMSVNQETGKWKCFSCNEGGGYVSYYAKTRGISISQALKDLNEFDENYKKRPIITQIQTPVKEIEPDPDYTDYIINQLSATMLHEKNFAFYGQKLYELRGITYPTAVACAISYDVNKGWLFPIMRYKGNGSICGYEVRKKDFTKFQNGNKCYKAKGTPSCLSIVYEPVGGSKKCICMEGFPDSYKMYQYLHENAQRKHGQYATVNKTIITPSCGVGSIESLLKENNFLPEFDEVIFVLDNDTPGREVTENIKQLDQNDRFKFFSDIKEDGWDFEKLYEEKLKGGTNDTRTTI